jgi:hypothetical protein
MKWGADRFHELKRGFAAHFLSSFEVAPSESQDGVIFAGRVYASQTDFDRVNASLRTVVLVGKCDRVLMSRRREGAASNRRRLKPLISSDSSCGKLARRMLVTLLATPTEPSD